ncbi:SDR family oxidoreductase [Halomonas meridiana]|uniref:SDR family NAD(P)-dependent oxidoreductase n=1 Tax=Vreelandella aquamarina TaxID=77097 RepID=UPI001E345CAB|nr:MULTISPECIES: SDR family oxidoreductase [Halomonas]MCD1650297.1 SDR family oxidoreductase [Halomonas axialensis]MCD2088906.1 SDR family oxidoreductase [Halomonas meridiana]
MPQQHQQVAVITGAAGEIPQQIALFFSKRNIKLVLTDIDEASLERFASTLGGEPDCLAIRHDVAKMEDAERVADACREAFGKVDYIVTGAGLYQHLSLAEIGEADWRRSMAINLDGVFFTIQALRPLLSEGSSIVNIASLAGQRGSLDHTPYAAAKGGVLTLTRSLAQELAPRTRVNAISPGLIDTRMMESLDAVKRQAMIGTTPLQRLGRPDEIASVVDFLCSDAASFMTGESLQVNGGLYIN